MTKRKFVDLGLLAADETWQPTGLQLIRVANDPQPGQYSFDEEARYWHLHHEAKGHFIGQYLDLEREEGSTALKMRCAAEYKFTVIGDDTVPFTAEELDRAELLPNEPSFQEHMLQTQIAEEYLRITFPAVHKTIHDDIGHPAFKTALEWAAWFITSARLVLASPATQRMFIDTVIKAQRDGQL